MSTPSVAAASLLQSASATPLPGTSATAPVSSTTAESAPTPPPSASAGAAAVTPAPTTDASVPAPALSPPVTGTAAPQQAAQGAQQAQAAAEPFNAPMLDLPARASTRDVLDGLTGAMADPTVNRTTAQRLFEFHQQLFEMEKAMTQVILDGMRS